MFMGPYDEGRDWNDKGIKGIDRFLKKVWKIISLPNANKDDEKTTQLMNKTIKIVTSNLKKMIFNTSISRLMEFVNHLSQHKEVSLSLKENLTLLLSPLSPHFSEEIWEKIGHKESIFSTPWPDYDASNIESNNLTIIVQINGKLRANFEIEKDQSKELVLNQAKSLDKIQKYLKDSELIKEIYVPNKLINFVIKNK